MGGTWRKSSYSGANGGDCAEVAATPGLVLVRDTKNRVSATLAFTAQAWRTFTEQVKQH
jgi:predicted secreted Zn-dependent protease